MAMIRKPIVIGPSYRNRLKRGNAIVDPMMLPLFCQFSDGWENVQLWPLCLRHRGRDRMLSVKAPWLAILS